jgi:two-component system, chemotaxis family, chemotaxis protein CheY
MRVSGTRSTSASGHDRAQRSNRREPVPDRPIMVVEDDPDLRDALEYLLKACGYQVVPARDGEEALEQLRGGLDPCLILLDLLMPRKDGFQFRSEQLETPAFAKIPTIAYSGIYTGTSLREKATALGIEAVLDKPVDYDGLLDLVEKYCPRA